MEREGKERDEMVGREGVRRSGADHFPHWRYTCIDVIQALQCFSAIIKLINK